MKLNKGNMNRGRCRFFIALTFIFLLLTFILLLEKRCESSQQELETEKQRTFRCEQQKESLNMQLRSEIEQKFRLKQNQKEEINEKLETKHYMELKLKEQNNTYNQQLDRIRLKYEKLQQNFKSLKVENELVADRKVWERKYQKINEELLKSKESQAQEAKMWKDKYELERSHLETILKESDIKEQHLERLRSLEKVVKECKANCNYKVNAFLENLEPKGPKGNLRQYPVNEKDFSEQNVVSSGLYEILAVKELKQQTEKQAITKTNSTQMPINFNNKISDNRTSDNVNIIGLSDGSDVGGGAIGVISVKNSNAFAQYLPFSSQNNRSLIINSVENFQIVPKPLKKLSGEDKINTEQQQHKKSNGYNGDSKVSPLSAPRKQTSTEASKVGANAYLHQALTNRTSGTVSSSTSQIPPLPLLNSAAKANFVRKIPANVAPIPDDQILRNEADEGYVVDKNKQKKNERRDAEAAAPLRDGGIIVGGSAEALEDLVNEKNNGDSNNNNNNRYANVVNDMAGGNGSIQKAKHRTAQLLAKHQKNHNLDSGGHEIKDNNDLLNEHNLNMVRNGNGNNIFDLKVHKANNNKYTDEKQGNPNFDDIGMGVDIAGKHSKQHDAFDDNPEDVILDGGIGLNAEEADDFKNNGKNQPNERPVENHHLLDDDDNNNLNNEVAGDQGKEFPADGIHLEEINEEDEDEDDGDYANLAARQQGVQAIRN